MLRMYTNIWLAMDGRDLHGSFAANDTNIFFATDGTDFFAANAANDTNFLPRMALMRTDFLH